MHLRQQANTIKESIVYTYPVEFKVRYIGGGNFTNNLVISVNAFDEADALSKALDAAQEAGFDVEGCEIA